nr:hypothetical protein [Tanacetum cinerariifolium]
NSSLEKICLGDDVVVISSDKVEGSGDWNSPEYQDTTGSKGNKVVNALSFYRMETDEISERYIAPCFMNGFKAYDGEVNLEFDESLISNEFAVKLCLDYEEDDFEPRVILGRSFLRVTHGVVDFGNGVITIYHEPARGHLTQEDAEKEALAIRISQKFALLEEERPVIKTMAYNDKYKKILDEIWRDKVELYGKIVKEEEEAVEGSGDWNSPEYQDTTGSKGNKVVNALSFYRMETDEISERYIAPCFMNGFKAYDGEVNLEFDESLISNEFAVKLCLDYEEDDFEPRVILGRSFLRLTHGVVDFGNGVIMIYHEPGPFEDDSKKQERAQTIGINYLISILMMCQSLEKNFLHLDKVELYGKIVKEEEEAVERIMREALKEKDDPGTFIFPIRLEGKVNENALGDTGSDINIMPYQIHETLGREETKKIDRGITMINYTQAKAIGKLFDVLFQVGVTTIIAKFIILDIPIDRDAPIVVG